MKRELTKSFSRISFPIFVYLTVICLCFVFVNSAIHAEGNIDLSDWLGEYQSQEQLHKLYSEYIESFDEYMELYQRNNLDVSELYIRKYVYEYAIENKVPAKDATVYAETSPFSGRDRVSILLTTDIIVLFIMLIVSCYLADLFVSADFSSRTHRFLYAGQKRERIIGEKGLAYFATFIGLYIFVQLICFLFCEVFSTPVKEILYVYDEKVIGRSPVTASIIEAFSVLVQLIPFAIVFFSIAMLIRNSIASIVMCIGVFLFVFYCCQKANDTMMASIGTTPMYSVCFGHVWKVPVSVWLKGYFIEITVAIGLAVFSLWRFRKADLI